MKRKKFSIFTSATIPYGLRMKAAIAFADMLETVHTKNPSSRYFSPRRGMSIQRCKCRFRRNTFCPSFHRYSEMVPTGHSQLQNALRKRNAIERNVKSKNIAAGCSAGTLAVTRKYLRFIMPAIGSHPSTPAGRLTYGDEPL